MPEPYPKDYRDCWDYNHVKMPCSKHNLLIDKDNVRALISYIILLLLLLFCINILEF